MRIAVEIHGEYCMMGAWSVENLNFGQKSLGHFHNMTTSENNFSKHTYYSTCITFPEFPSPQSNVGLKENVGGVPNILSKTPKTVG